MRCASLSCDNGASSMFPEPYGPQINKVEDRTMTKDPMFPGSCVTKALISQGSLCSQIKMIDNESMTKGLLFPGPMFSGLGLRVLGSLCQSCPTWDHVVAI